MKYVTPIILALACGGCDADQDDQCVVALACGDACPSVAESTAEAEGRECLDSTACQTTVYQCDDLTVVSWGDTVGSVEDFFDADGKQIARFTATDYAPECADSWQGTKVSCDACTADGAPVSRGFLALAGCP